MFEQNRYQLVVLEGFFGLFVFFIAKSQVEQNFGVFYVVGLELLVKVNRLIVLAELKMTGGEVKKT